MNLCATGTDHRCGQEGHQHRQHEVARARIARQVEQDAHQLAEVDGQNGQDGAELDQHLEGLAGRLEAQEMAGQQDVAGGGNGDELGQALDQPEHDHLPDGHLRLLGVAIIVRGQDQSRAGAVPVSTPAGPCASSRAGCESGLVVAGLHRYCWGGSRE
jgi:hypothetical protein